LVGAMLVAGPLAAVFTLLFAKIMLGDNPLQQLGGSFVLSWLGIFVVGMLPQILSGLAVTGLERTVAGKLEGRTFQAAPQIGRAIASGAATGVVRGAAAAGAAGTAALAGAAARNVRLARPLVDAMRAGGMMVGKARAAVSNAVSGLQNRIQDRVSGLTARAEAGRRLVALEGLKARFEELSAMSPKERRREAAVLERHLGELAEEGLLSRREHLELLGELKDPAGAIQTLDRLIEEAREAALEYEKLNVYEKLKLKADLAFARIGLKPISKGIDSARDSARELESRALRMVGLGRRELGGLRPLRGRGGRKRKGGETGQLPPQWM
jgi:hypothetical protein